MRDVRMKIEAMLTHAHVPYEAIRHRRASSAAMTALAEHVPPNEHLKVVILEADGKPVMAVVPGDRRIDLKKMKSVLGAGSVRVEFEHEFEDLFEGCETGAMPPFGDLFGVPLYADASISENISVCFNAGSHRNAIRMPLPDYVRLAKPVFADIAAGGAPS